MLIILTGCTSKSNFLISFDTFTIKIYDNNKQYVIVPWETKNSVGMKVISQMKEETVEEYTGFINSLVIASIFVQSWADIKTLVDSNNKKIENQLLQYKNTNITKKKVKCGTLQYSWYISTFSYQLDTQTIYNGQYYFIDTTSLYIISLASEDQKDIKTFIKSIGDIKCNK